MSKLKDIEKVLITTDKMERVGNRKELDFRACAYDALREAAQLSERVEELEEQLKTKLSQWSKACQKKDEFELRSYRYKQALEEALKYVAPGSHIFNVLNDALKGESI